MPIKTDLLLLALIICLTACTVPSEPTALPPATTIPKPGEPVAPPTADLPTAYPPPPRATATVPYPYPQPLPSPTLNMTPVYIVEPTNTAEPTIPRPTLPPTPAVTPIPLAHPDLADLLPAESGPLWIYYWDESQIWRTDENGVSTELVLDVAQTLGRPLGAIPGPLLGTDCCWLGPAVVISPDGTKLAITVGGEALDPTWGINYTLYTFDLETGQLLDFGEGNWPVWSPAGDQLLFQRHGDLWLGELASGATQLILPQTALNGNLLSYLVWLTDEMVAFTPRQGAQWVPEIWLMALAQPDLKTKIAAELYPMYMLSVDPSGPELYFLSDLGSLFPHHLSNIWKVSSTTGSLQQITAGFNIYKYHLYPETHTLLFSGFQAFARPDEAYDMDLWLLDLETDDLYRLTNGLDRGHLLGWYPAGRNFILHDTTDATLWALAENFTLRPLANGRSFQDDRRDAKFAITGLR